MMESKDEDHKSEHKQLASLIKGVHKHLRRKLRESSGDHETVWEDHSQNSAMLKSYAEAMKVLAKEHWSIYPESRIDWCYKIITEYFLSGGLKRALEKDAKQKFFEMQRKAKMENQETSAIEELNQCSPEISHRSPCQSLLQVSDPADKRQEICRLSLEEAVDQETNHSCPDEVDLIGHTDEAAATQIRLLDVGSCYNPFKDYHHLDSIAVDLCPADDSVFQCDFLQLQLIPSIEDESISKLFQNLKSPILQLPRCCFDVVVFCLLLEYLPSSVQRLQCCIKASRLLRMNGLLILVTPDSKSSHRNAPMMKSWRTALDRLGMVRWKYQKMQHLHCMAFRKVSEHHSSDLISMEKELAPLLYIPQDFSDACYDDVEKSDTDSQNQLRTSEENEKFCSLTLDELPAFVCDLD